MIYTTGMIDSQPAPPGKPVNSQGATDTKSEGELVTTLATSVDKFGRPSKLTPQVIQQAWDYLHEIESISPTAGGLLPTKERLALKLGVTRQTMENWAKESADFLDIVNNLEKLQADRLIQFSLIGKYNPMISKLLLSKHGYVEKSEQDVTSDGKGLQPVLVSFINNKTDVIDATSTDTNTD